MALYNPDHTILNLIMKHEDAFNAIDVNHSALKKIEQKVRAQGYSRVATMLEHRNYSSAVAMVAERMSNWEI